MKKIFLVLLAIVNVLISLGALSVTLQKGDELAVHGGQEVLFLELVFAPEVNTTVTNIIVRLSGSTDPELPLGDVDAYDYIDSCTATAPAVGRNPAYNVGPRVFPSMTRWVMNFDGVLPIRAGKTRVVSIRCDLRNPTDLDDVFLHALIQDGGVVAVDATGGSVPVEFYEVGASTTSSGVNLTPDVVVEVHPHGELFVDEAYEADIDEVIFAGETEVLQGEEYFYSTGEGFFIGELSLWACVSPTPDLGFTCATPGDIDVSWGIVTLHWLDELFNEQTAIAFDFGGWVTFTGLNIPVDGLTPVWWSIDVNDASVVEDGQQVQYNLADDGSGTRFQAVGAYSWDVIYDLPGTYHVGYDQKVTVP